MTFLAILTAIFFPYIGSAIRGKWIPAIIQFILEVLAWILIATVILSFLGGIIMLINHVWGIVCAATPKPERPSKYRL